MRAEVATTGTAGRGRGATRRHGGRRLIALLSTLTVMSCLGGGVARAETVDPEPPTTEGSATNPIPKISTDSSDRAPSASPSASASVLAVPANDLFANAIAVAAGSTSTGSNVGATKQAGELVHASNSGGASVWWKVTLSPGAYVVDTDSSSFDTLLSVYTGPAFDNLAAVASNDDSPVGGTTSKVAFTATPGTYYIVVDGYRSGTTVATGSITLHVGLSSGSAFAPPSNDNFAGAYTFTVLEDLTADLYGSTIAATPEAGEPLAGGYAAKRSVWFRFISPVTGTLTATTFGSGFDTILDVYTGSSIATLVPVPNGSNDDENRAGNVLTSSVTNVPITSATAYYLRIDGYAGVQGYIVLGVTVAGTVPVGTATSPGVPRDVKVDAGDGQATVTWAAPVSDGGSPITSYTVTASPGGSTCTWTSGPLSCVVTGLSNGTAYTFTVTVKTAVGSAGTPPTSPVTPGKSGYVSLTPARLLDTRGGRSTVDGQFNGIGAVGAGATLNVTVVGRAGVPTSGVDAVVLNVTVTEPTASGYVTVFPAGEQPPTASNLNFVPAQTVPNLVIAKVGANGQISLYNSAGSTHLIVDIVGWLPS